MWPGPLNKVEVQKRLTLEGNIVISVGLFGLAGDKEVWENMDDRGQSAIAPLTCRAGRAEDFAGNQICRIT